MLNVGEEICGEYLRRVKNCDFIRYNTKLADVQGEIDVIGINLPNKIVYACEVVVHLTTGMMYYRNSRSKKRGNVEILTSKFEKDYAYLQEAFPEYEKALMLWSPIVKNQGPRAKHNQLNDVRKIVEKVKTDTGIEIQTIINDSYLEALDELRNIASGETKELGSSFMRYLQIEEYLKKHLSQLQ